MDDRRRTIGEILLGFGRISEADVAAALEYQEAHGGYFGEALLALGRVTAEEVEWSLASQFDLPYVFPDADAIDPEAAALVTPHWALRHLALPIMKTDETLTVVVDSPDRGDAIRELQASSGMEIELALAPARKIRELIRRVYAEGTGMGESATDDAPVSLSELFSAAVDEGAASFGISVRGSRAVGWYRTEGKSRNRALFPGWRDDLEDYLVPSPATTIEEGKSGRWRGRLDWNDRLQPVEVRFLSAPHGMEFAFTPAAARPAEPDRMPRPPAAILSEVSLLVRAGAARFLVSLDPALGPGLLPRLPSLLLDPLTRSVHLGPPPDGDDSILTAELPEDAAQRDLMLAELESYRFDALTMSVESGAEGWLSHVLDVAPVVFVAGSPEVPVDRAAAAGAGLGWSVSVRAKERGGRAEWSIEPLET